MKRFLIRVLLFFAVLAVIDRLSGYAFSYLSENAKGGYTGHYHFLVDKTNEDILIFGSSRAIHHYNPQIITDSLGMTCFNCGQNGNGIVLFYGWWKVISERYHPKMIIYDITTDFDLLAGDNHKYLGWLKEAYDRNGVKEVFMEVDSTEKYKMMSQMYRYNSKWHQIAADYIYPLYVVNDNGFFPLEGGAETMRIREDVDIYKPFKLDELKIDFINKLVEDAGDTKIVFVVSPTLYGLNEAQIDPIKKICVDNKIPLYDFSNNPKYVHQVKYFKDGSHMNAWGADEFTRDLVTTIK